MTITDPAAMMARTIALSPTARRCIRCLAHVQVMRGDGDTLILDAYPSDDGVYSIRADCRSVYRTEGGPARYGLHRCDGDE
jgi:hypothetical protein